VKHILPHISSSWPARVWLVHSWAAKTTALPFGNSARPYRPTFLHKLAQVEQVQAPSWYRICAMAQGMASIVGIWLVPWHKERFLLTSPRPNGLEQVWYSQPACASGTSTTCSNILVPLGQVVLVPQAQALPVPIYLCHRDQVPGPILGSSLIKNQRGPNRISEIPYQKSVSNRSKIETKNRFFSLFLY